MCNNVDFGSFIREKREYLNYSREYLAEQCSLSDKCIANIERGKSNPKLSTVLELCCACNINIGELSEVVMIGDCL